MGRVTAEDLQKIVSHTPVPAVVIGIALLAFGRKLFWLFVAATGFMIGTELATAFFPQQQGMALISGIVLGIACGLLAILVQKIAVSVGGFLAGGFFLLTLLRAWALLPPDYSWVAFLVGGLIGAILMAFVFDWALIIFSSIGGAHLIVHSLQLTQTMSSALFVVLLFVGCVFQARLLGRKSGNGE